MRLQRLVAFLVVLQGLAARPALAQQPSDEPRSLHGPFAWTQQRGQFGAVIHGELKLRILPAAGTFTCFVTGQGKLQGRLAVGPSVTRIDGTVSMAASTCSGTWDAATGALTGTAQLRVRTSGKTDVDIQAQGGAQHHSQPIDADVTDALFLSGTVGATSGSGKARYVKGGAFDWTVAAEVATSPPGPPPPPPTQPQPPHQPLPPGLPQPPGQPQPPKVPPDLPKKPKKPATQAEIDQLAAAQHQAQSALNAALQAQAAQQAQAEALDEAAGKGVQEGLKASIEHGAKVLDEALKHNSWDEHAPPGPASKAWNTLDRLNKLKELLADFRAIQKTFAGVDQEVKNGSYGATSGKMIKGTAVLGKTIKIVVDKLPVVGTAGAEIVDQTFGVVVKTATQRAKTGARWECCMDDPTSDCCAGD